MKRLLFLLFWLLLLIAGVVAGAKSCSHEHLPEAELVDTVNTSPETEYDEESTVIVDPAAPTPYPAHNDDGDALYPGQGDAE